MKINKRIITKADPEELRDMLKTLDKENLFYGVVLNELTRQASIDQLTGLCNRNLWPGRFIRELRYIDQNSKYLGCILLDVDDFKAVNDIYGYDFGDLLLNKLGRCINDRLRHILQEQREERRKQGKLRTSDIIGRFGGEEFIIFVPQEYDNLKEAWHGLREVGEKIQLIGEAITTSAVIESLYKTPKKYITLSLGCELYQGKPGKSSEFYDPFFDRKKISSHPLILKANKFLKKAKKHGKNQVICLEEIV